MKFDFNCAVTALGSIDIEDIGNFCLEAIDEDLQVNYYLIVRTSLGTSSIVSYGPVVPDVIFLPREYSTQFIRTPFKDSKMIKWITNWLNNKAITSAKVVTWEEAFKEYRDLKDYMEKYCDEVY